MLPASPRYNIADALMGDSQQSSQRFVRIIAGSIKLPDSFYFISCPFGSVNLLSRYKFLPSFKEFIRIVIFSSSKEKMRWVATRRIVAFVKNTNSIGNGSVNHFPRKSVCQNRLVHNLNRSIPKFIFPVLPNPTGFFTNLIDVRPKIIFESRLSKTSDFSVCSEFSHASSVEQHIKQVKVYHG